MSFWNIFSQGNLVEKTTDAIVSAGDKLFYTDEEKADMKLKMQNMHIKLLTAYHPFRVSQRIVAFAFVGSFLFSFLSASLMGIINVFIKYNTKAGEKLITLDTNEIYMIVEKYEIAPIVFVIVSFYYGGGALESLGRTLKKGK